MADDVLEVEALGQLRGVQTLRVELSRDRDAQDLWPGAAAGQTALRAKAAPRDPFDEEPRDPLDADPLFEDAAAVPEPRRAAAVPELRRDGALRAFVAFVALVVFAFVAFVVFVALVGCVALVGLVVLVALVALAAGEPAPRPDVLLALLRAVAAALREPPLPLRALLVAAVRLVCLRDVLVVATRSPFPGLLRRYPRFGGR